MTGQMRFEDDLHAWFLALGFISFTAVLITVTVAVLIYTKSFGNPFTPFIRAFERRQVHRQRMKEMALRAELAARGLDPGYVLMLEKKAREQA
jgi:hypothetical protein